VLTEDSYKKNAFRLQEAIRQAGGVNRAADIIEQAISTGKAVLAHPGGYAHSYNSEQMPFNYKYPSTN
jgi:hypothetical protein